MVRSAEIPSYHNIFNESVSQLAFSWPVYFSGSSSSIKVKNAKGDPPGPIEPITRHLDIMFGPRLVACNVLCPLACCILSRMQDDLSPEHGRTQPEFRPKAVR
jgi:hypothetical protein